MKSEAEHTNFDRALGTISKHGENIEVIRIYAPEMNENILIELGYFYKKYLPQEQ